MRTFAMLGAMALSISLTACGRDTTTLAGPDGVWVLNVASTEREFVENRVEIAMELMKEQFKEMLEDIPEANRPMAAAKLREKLASPESGARLEKTLRPVLDRLSNCRIELKPGGAYRASLINMDGIPREDEGQWRLRGNRVEFKSDQSDAYEGEVDVTFANNALRLTISRFPFSVHMRRK